MNQENVITSHAFYAKGKETFKMIKEDDLIGLYHLEDSVLLNPSAYNQGDFDGEKFSFFVYMQFAQIRYTHIKMNDPDMDIDDAMDIAFSQARIDIRIPINYATGKKG